MRISQKLDYAQRSVLQLSKVYDGKTVVKLDALSEVEAIPSAFLVQILNELKKANVVTSKRGKAGGYLLAQPPSQITLADIINAVDPHMLDKEASQFEGQSAPILDSLWKGLSHNFSREVAKITFEELISEDREPMWFI